MAMIGKQPHYLSYLLRLWREEHGGPGSLRGAGGEAVGGRNPGVVKRRAFANLAALFAFLEAETGAAGPAEEAQQPPGENAPGSAPGGSG